MTPTCSPTQPSARRRRPALFAPALAALTLAGAGWLVAAAPQPPQQPPAAPADPAAPAGQDDVTLVLSGQGRARFRLALPALERPGAGAPAEAGGAASELDSTLRSDLVASGAFDLQGPAELAVAALTGDRAHDFEQYRALGNELLILGSVDVESGRPGIVFEGRLYDLAGGQSILAKRYRGPWSAARRIAHTFADDVVEHVTGRPGLARTTIAFASDRSGKKELYVMDYDGAEQRPVTGHRSTSMSPAWRPDGGGLAYTSFVGGAPALYFADLASGRKNPLVTDGDQNISASYSPDGRRIVFARALGANSEVFVADADGRNLTRLTHHAAIDTSPAWSPQGSEIAFTSSRGGSPQIYLMDAEGTNVRRVTHEGNYNDGAVWNPAGDTLAYASRRGGAFDIAVTEIVTLETRLLTRGPGSNEEPSFAPSGRRIAFTSNRAGGKQIWAMNADDGGELVQLTRQGRNESPAWSPFPRE